MSPLIPAKDVSKHSLIIRAIYERDAVQHEAIFEMNKRGAWLSDNQKAQAGLTAEEYFTLCYTPPKSMPVTDRHINEALNRLNGQRGKAYPDKGYVYYADIKGDGSNRKGFWQIIDANGAVSNAGYEFRGKTKRATVARIVAVIWKEMTGA